MNHDDDCFPLSCKLAMQREDPNDKIREILKNFNDKRKTFPSGKNAYRPAVSAEALTQ